MPPPPPPTARTSPGALASALVATLVALTVLAVPFVPAQLRWREYHAAPPLAVCFALAVYAAIALATARTEARGLVRAMLVGCLFVAHVAATVQPLGDASAWIAFAHTDAAGASELLSNTVHRLVYRCTGNQGLHFVAPVAGALLGWVFLRFVDRTLVVAGSRRAAHVRRLAAAVLALSGWQLLCFRGYIENTLPSLPFAVLGLEQLVRCARDHRGGHERRAAAWLALACTFHGAQVSLLCALPLTILVVRHRRGALGEAWRSLLACGAIVIVVVGAAVLGVWLLGLQIGAGHVGGGGDGGHFVPFARTGDSPYYEFLMLELAHFAAVGNLLLFGSPLVLATAGLVWSRRWRRAVQGTFAARPAMAIAGLGAGGLTSIYYFDLAFPYDLDLMTAMSMPVGLWLLQVAACAPRAMRPWLLSAVLVNGALVWTLAGSLLVAPSTRAATDLLLVNRRTGDVRLRIGEGASLSVQLPDSGTAPFRFAVHAWLGDLPAVGDGDGDGDARAPRGMAFPIAGTPGADPGRAFVIVHPEQLGLLGHLAPELREPWLSPPLPATKWFGAWTVQAVLHDADGRTFVSNVVRLVP